MSTIPLRLLLVVVYISLPWPLITASHPSKQKANMTHTVDTKTYGDAEEVEAKAALSHVDHAYDLEE
jgi:hypothetical protein